MAEGTEIIEIDPEILRAVAKDLTAVGEDVAGAGQRIAATPLSASAFGLMNAWMAPPISGLVSHVAELVQVTGGLATAVGAATSEAAADFERNEAGIVDTIGGLQRQIDQVAGRAILR